MAYYPYFDRESTPVQVPETIEFGTSCLTVPELVSAGLPEGLAKLPLLEPLVKIGDWVMRNQPILSAKLPVFDGAEPPSRWTPWLDDRFSYLEHTLTSPISGLVVNMHRTRGAYHGLARATHSGMSICYGEHAILPTLLVPEDEPPAPRWDTSFFDGLSSSLRGNFERVLYSHRDGYRRLGTVLDQFDAKTLAEMSAYRSSNQRRETLPTTFESIADSPNAVAMVIELRSHVVSLRRKLRHIGGVAS